MSGLAWTVLMVGKLICPPTSYFIDIYKALYVKKKVKQFPLDRVYFIDSMSSNNYVLLDLEFYRLVFWLM